MRIGVDSQLVNGLRLNASLRNVSFFDVIKGLVLKFASELVVVFLLACENKEISAIMGGE